MSTPAALKKESIVRLTSSPTTTLCRPEGEPGEGCGGGWLVAQSSKDREPVSTNMSGMGSPAMPLFIGGRFPWGQEGD